MGVKWKRNAKKKNELECYLVGACLKGKERKGWSSSQQNAPTMCKESIYS